MWINLVSPLKLLILLLVYNRYFTKVGTLGKLNLEDIYIFVLHLVWKTFV
jgi:hypothetical protein